MKAIIHPKLIKLTDTMAYPIRINSATLVQDSRGRFDFISTIEVFQLKYQFNLSEVIQAEEQLNLPNVLQAIWHDKDAGTK